MQNAIFLELESKGVNPVHFQSHDIIIVVIIIKITMIIIIIIIIIIILFNFKKICT